MNYQGPYNGFRESQRNSRPGLSLQRERLTIAHWAIAPIAMTLDALIIITTSVVGGIAYHLYSFNVLGDVMQFAALATIVAALFVLLAKNSDLYKISVLANLKVQIQPIVFIWAVIFLFLSAAVFLMKLGDSFSRGATIIFAVAGLAGLITTRAVWSTILANDALVRKFSGRRVALLTQSWANDLDSFSLHGLQVAFHFMLPSNLNDEQDQKAFVSQVVSSVRGSHIDEIVVAVNLDNWPILKSLIENLKILPFPITLIPLGQIANIFLLPSHIIGNTVTVELHRGPRTLFERLLKRLIDMILSAAALVMLLPLFLLTVFAIKLDSPGPVIFRQRRCGFNGRQFNIYKFRTMSVIEDGDAVQHAKRDDARVTNIGYWLRRTSIDELPQLFNVLRGDMSLVGPRPHALAHDSQFDKLVNKYMFRHHVIPGITGWAQIHGQRGSMTTIDEIERRVQMDLWYIEHWSLVLDLNIMAHTFLEIVRGKNAY